MVTKSRPFTETKHKMFFKKYYENNKIFLSFWWTLFYSSLLRRIQQRFQDNNGLMEPSEKVLVVIFIVFSCRLNMRKLFRSSKLS